jgi:hypothetical protein
MTRTHIDHDANHEDEPFKFEIHGLMTRVGRYDAGALLAAAAIMQTTEEPDSKSEDRVHQIRTRLHDWLNLDDTHLTRAVTFARLITRTVIREYSEAAPHAQPL